MTITRLCKSKIFSRTFQLKSTIASHENTIETLKSQMKFLEENLDSERQHSIGEILNRKFSSKIFFFFYKFHFQISKSKSTSSNRK